MSHRADFSPEAPGDLIDLYDYIAMRDGAERAIDYIDRIEDFAAVSRFFRTVVAGAKICGGAYGFLASNVVLLLRLKSLLTR